MKKKLLTVLALGALVFSLGACGNQGSSGNDDGGGQSGQTTTRYTVAFEVDGERYKTLSVVEGEKITENVPNPEKEGYTFDCWLEEGTTRVEDLTQYTVTKNVTFTAAFKEATTQLSVDDVKDDSKTYYIVLGWWESTDTENASFPYSGLTRDSVRLFYKNFIKYLTVTGATSDDIAAISFRNYSSNGVAAMGEAVNADGDVDLLIGVGANVFTTAQCVPFDASDNSKFQTTMGTAGKSRYVALLQNAREVAQTAFEWLQTDTGKESFVREITDEEIATSLQPEQINLTVTVHGDTDAVTTLTDKDTAITMPTITTPEGKEYKGFATSADGEVVLSKAVDATLKYDDVKSLVAEGSNTLDLYPVFEDIPEQAADLTVYVQTHATRLPEYEAKLIEARYENATGKDIELVLNNGNASTFQAAVEADTTADVAIGGNNPLANFSLAADTTLENLGAMHCADTSRKVVILSTCSTDQLETAKDFYNFMVADAAAIEMHTTFWRVGTWVTAEEEAAIKTAEETALNTLFAIGEGETLEAKYNVTLGYAETTSDKVAALGDETRALRDGKGTDLIIGAGANVTTTGGFADAVVRDIPTETVAAGRKAALINDNILSRTVLDAIAPETAE